MFDDEEEYNYSEDKDYREQMYFEEEVDFFEEQEMSEKLANYVMEEIISEFSNTHLTNNLVDTMYMTFEEDKFVINIPAQKYDFKAWFLDKAIVYTGKGSYAYELDAFGSMITIYWKRKQLLHSGRRSIGKKFVYIGNHAGYMERNMLEAVRRLGGEEECQWKVEIR